MTHDTRIGVANRKYQRCIPETAYVAYRIGLPLFGQTGESPVIDLSENGLMLKLAERVKWGAKARMTITVSRFEDEFSVSGIVRRCFESKKDSQLYAGIEFVNVSPRAYETLRRICAYFNSPEYKAKCSARDENDLIF